VDFLPTSFAELFVAGAGNLVFYGVILPRETKSFVVAALFAFFESCRDFYFFHMKEVKKIDGVNFFHRGFV